MSTYYVAVSGSDGAAGSIGAPWQTISKVNGSVFSSGDSVLLNCGDEWRDTLVPPSSGSAGLPITFGSYGTGAAPIINGSTIVSSWTAEVIGAYTAYKKASISSEPTQVFQNNVRLTHAGSKTTMAIGSWWWESNTLYIRATDNVDPVAKTIEASYGRSNGIYTTGKSYLTFSGLVVTKATYDGIQTNDGSHIIFTRCESSWNAYVGIIIIGASDALIDSLSSHHNGSSGAGYYRGTASFGHENIIQRSDIYDNGEHGIGITDNYCIVQRNHIHENGSLTVSGGCTGIELYSDDGSNGWAQHNIVRYNLIWGQVSSGTDGEGIQADNGSGFTEIYGNVACGNDGPGFSLNRGSDVKFYNNTSYGNNLNSSGELGSTGEFRFGGPTGTNVICKNNIGHSTLSSAQAIFIDASVAVASGLDISNNCWYAPNASNFYSFNGTPGNSLATWNALTGVGTDLNGNPQFTNTGAGDFTLQSGSPCIDVGVNLGLTYGDGLHPASSWPLAVSVLGQNGQGSGWEIGAYVYRVAGGQGLLFAH